MAPRRACIRIAHALANTATAPQIQLATGTCLHPRVHGGVSVSLWILRFTSQVSSEEENNVDLFVFGTAVTYLYSLPCDLVHVSNFVKVKVQPCSILYNIMLVLS